MLKSKKKNEKFTRLGFEQFTRKFSNKFINLSDALKKIQNKIWALFFKHSIGFEMTIYMLYGEMINRKYKAKKLGKSIEKYEGLDQLDRWQLLVGFKYVN